MSKPIKATLWNLTDRVWSMLIGFLISIFLARLLTPVDYGLVGIGIIVTSFCEVFIEAGFSNALIRKLDRTDRDLSTAFLFNLFIGLFVYIVVYVSSPLIASFFEDAILIPVIRIASLSVIINSLCIVQNAILTIDLKMKEQAVINISSQIPAGLLALFLAFRGLGVYALVVQSVLYAFLRMLFLWRVAKWYPTLIFDLGSFKYLWGFGSRLLGANLLGTAYNNINSFLLGKYISKSDLGQYTQANSLASRPEGICLGVIQKVVIPVLAKYQNDSFLLKEKYRLLMKCITCIMTFIGTYLIVNASPIIRIIWGEKWLPAIPIFQIIVLSTTIVYVSCLTLILLQIVGRTDYLFRLEFIKKPSAVLIIFVLIQFKLEGLLAALLLNSVISCAVNMSSPKKFLDYGYMEQVKDVIVYISGMGLCILAVIIFNTFVVSCVGIIPRFFIYSIIVVVLYCGWLFLMKDQFIIMVIKLISR